MAIVWHQRPELKARRLQGLTGHRGPLGVSRDFLRQVVQVKVLDPVGSLPSSDTVPVLTPGVLPGLFADDHSQARTGSTLYFNIFVLMNSLRKRPGGAAV